MKRTLQKSAIALLLVAALVLTLPSAALSDSHGALLPDELVLLSHLPDQQIGKEYPKGETINV